MFAILGLRAWRAAALCLLFSVPALAQSPGTGTGGAGLLQPSAEELDGLLASIALYPDPLLAQVLRGATRAIEIVEADRWMMDPSHQGLTGDALASALDEQPWDPGVKSLTAFPEVLHLMDDNLAWTQRLGDVFINAQGAVWDSVQRLRARARDAGTLQSSLRAMVSTEGQAIRIESPDPERVYVPVFDPRLAYGAWVPQQPAPFGFDGTPSGVVYDRPGFGYLSLGIVAPLWGWGRPDWRHRRVDIDEARFNALSPDSHVRSRQGREGRESREGREDYGGPGLAPGSRPDSTRAPGQSKAPLARAPELAAVTPPAHPWAGLPRPAPRARGHEPVGVTPPAHSPGAVPGPVPGFAPHRMPVPEHVRAPEAPRPATPQPPARQPVTAKEEARAPQDRPHP